MSEVKLGVAALGTREEVRKVKASVVVTAAADQTDTLAVVFENPYVEIPEIIGVVCVDAAGVKGKWSATDVTKVGMNVNSYKVLDADVAAGTYVVEVTLVGWKAA